MENRVQEEEDKEQDGMSNKSQQHFWEEMTQHVEQV